MLRSYRLPLRKAKTKITAGPAMTINATESSWKITSQLTFAIASNIFSSFLPIVSKRLDNQSVAKPAIDHIRQWYVIFNILYKIIGKNTKWQTGYV
jgi:hypothetical protein